MTAHVLVIDDSPTIRKVVRSMLNRHGFRVSEAPDGVAALEQLRDGLAIDLILLDFIMPRLNGFRFCRALETQGLAAQAPVVLMSAKASAVKKLFVEQTRVRLAIDKPFDEPALIDIVERALAPVPSSSIFDDVDEENEEDRTSTFQLSSAILAKASGPAWERQPTQPPPSPQGASDALAALFAPPPLPKPEPAAPSPAAITARIDLRSVWVEQLAELLDGALGLNVATFREALDSRLSTDDLRNLMLLGQELAPRPSLSGGLEAFSIAVVMRFLADEFSTGVLSVRREDDLRIEITLGGGAVDLVQGFGLPPALRSGQVFVQAGVLSAQELDDLLSEPTDSRRMREARAGRSSPPDLPLGERLLAMGRFDEGTHHDLLRQHSAVLFREVTRWTAGSFEFRSGKRSMLAVRARLGLATEELLKSLGRERGGLR